MVLPHTRPLSESIRFDLQRDPEFRRALLAEILGTMLTGDVDTGMSVMRHYINGTMGFMKLGSALGKSPKHLIRILGPAGNPNLRTFFEIVAYLQKVDRTILTVQGIAA